ncbi:MAG: aminopeptidase, partial [Chitinispirillaceae bacterium]|nr:aminopeptidase [Chitinispirillaceae bacterium]
MFLRIIIISIFLLGCSCCYILKQGVILISDQIRAKPIDKLKNKQNISIEEKKFFNEVEKIREFAFDTIGLIRNKNYTRFIRIERDYLVAVLCAADSLSFTTKKWCYPVMGCFPLRGYYHKKDAENEAKKLIKKGYEVNIDEVDGFSTLGIFSDPVYSFMEKYPIFFLANYIFHEQTHATLYFKDVQFSEELATFIGREGALKYLRSRFGEESTEYISAKQYLQDEDTYLSLLRALYKRLDIIYKSDKTKEEKL